MSNLNYILNTDVSVRGSPSPRITCNDGTGLSVQAGEFLYCSPRTNFAPWDTVEVGFPSQTPPDSWEEYYDGEWKTPLQKLLTTNFRFTFSWKRLEYYDSFWEKLGGLWRTLNRETRRITAPMGCESVYAWIPIELVREYIELHGGEKTK